MDSDMDETALSQIGEEDIHMEGSMPKPRGRPTGNRTLPAI